MACFRLFLVIQSGPKAACHKKQHVKYRVPIDPRGTRHSNSSSEMVTENYMKALHKPHIQLQITLPISHPYTLQPLIDTLKLGRRWMCMVYKILQQSSKLQLTNKQTNWLTPHTAVILEKPTVPQLVKKLPAFCGTDRFIAAVTKACHLFLSWTRSSQSMPPIPGLDGPF